MATSAYIVYTSIYNVCPLVQTISMGMVLSYNVIIQYDTITKK